MDELWQRYRTFWTPVLWGVGVFLVGLIAVHAVTGDPDAGRTGNENRAKDIRNRAAPSPAQAKAVEDGVAPLSKRVNDWARRLDQRHGEDPDVAVSAVRQMLRAAVARGKIPADPAAFEGDKDAAERATALYEARVRERLEQLRTQDPNVSFSRLQADVVQELRVRANRADVDVVPEQFGFDTITSVDRADLPRRLLNLALIATVVDVAIREGVRSVDAVTLLPSGTRAESQGADPFVLEWPVKIDVTGPPDALAEIVQVLTDGDRPIAFGDWSWRASDKKNGLVKAEMKLYSLRVRADATLGLESEGGE